MQSRGADVRSIDEVMLSFLGMIDEFLLHASCGKRTGHVLCNFYPFTLLHLHVL